MFVVQIVCSDPECTEEREVEVESLDEIDDIACACSHGFVAISVARLAEPARPGRVISLPDRRRSSRRRAA